MANASVMGVSWWDPLGSFGEGALNSHFTKKMAEFNSALQYEYAEKYARNNPTWQKEGLKAAGYNPLLAVSSGLASPFGGNVNGSVSNVSPGGYGGFDASAFAESKRAKDVVNSQADADIAEANAAQSAAELDKELNDIRLGAVRGMEKAAGESKYTSEFRQAFINAIERERYTNSREHAVAEDAVNAIHGGSSAFSNIASGMNFLRERSFREKLKKALR